MYLDNFPPPVERRDRELELRRPKEASSGEYKVDELDSDSDRVSEIEGRRELVRSGRSIMCRTASK